MMKEADGRVVHLFTKGSHHRNLSVIHLTQNLFHQGKGARDISLNTHYIVYFKNPRDRSQIFHLSRQLHPENPKFVQESYNDATEKPHGYLFIDLKHKSIKPLTPHYRNHLTSSKVAKHSDTLRFLASCSPSLRKSLLEAADSGLIRIICEIVDNTLKGVVQLNPSQKQRLARHKKILRKIAEKSGCWKKKKKIIVQSGGFILPLLLPIVSASEENGFGATRDDNPNEKLLIGDDRCWGDGFRSRSCNGKNFTMPKLSDHEKWNLYKQSLQRFLHFSDEERKPATLTISPVNSGKNDEEAMEETGHVNVHDHSASDRIRSEIVATVPKKFKKKAQLLVDRLASSGNIKWDQTGTISMRGNKLTGTNIIDLVGDLMRKRKDFSPTGLVPFLNSLSEINVPHEFIGNADHLRYIQNVSSKEKAGPIHLDTTPVFKPRYLIPRKPPRWVPYRFKN
ncbi:hypothetical protein J437_LFUL017844 [Ladona fulva]|uniref:Uncharacterized protein n=1 Tax=Ladona fulva TaxID=123851 RepID=A0A8K0PCC6_LADFU|nr:hypothetical protein J437_LFUL017844 [Ladona fulva]